MKKKDSKKLENLFSFSLIVLGREKNMLAITLVYVLWSSAFAVLPFNIKYQQRLDSFLVTFRKIFFYYYS